LAQRGRKDASGFNKRRDGGKVTGIEKHSYPILDIYKKNYTNRVVGQVILARQTKISCEKVNNHCVEDHGYE